MQKYRALLEELFDTEHEFYFLNNREVSIYHLKNEFAEEILSKIFIEKNQKELFDGKSLKEQLSHLRLYHSYSLADFFRENASSNVHISEGKNIKVMPREDLCALYAQGESLDGCNSFHAQNIDGILLYDNTLIGLLFKNNFLWIGTVIYCLESDIDCSGDNNGAGYRGGGDTTENICALTYIANDNDQEGSVLYYHPSHKEIEIFDASEIEVVANNAFIECRNLKKIIFSEKLRIISKNAFYSCSSLEEIVFQKGLEKIEEGAFSYCTALKKISIPSKISVIPSKAFYSCRSLEEINLPEGLEKICTEAFAYCTALKRISIPSKVSVIPSKAFYSCSSLEEINLPASLYEVDNEAFLMCELKKIVFPKDIGNTSQRVSIYETQKNKLQLITSSPSELIISQNSESLSIELAYCSSQLTFECRSFKLSIVDSQAMDIYILGKDTDMILNHEFKSLKIVVHAPRDSKARIAAEKYNISFVAI